MQLSRPLAAAILCCAVLLALAGCITSNPPSTPEVGILYSKGTGPMPMLLATDQVDGYIAWQPFVEVAPLAGIGKVIAYSADLPPAGEWEDHPCCVFAVRSDLMAENPDLVNAVAAATILATDYTTQHPDESAEIVADWLAGKGNFTYGNISVSSVEVLKQAFPTVKFVNEPTEAWMDGQVEFVHALRDLNTLTGSLANTSDTEVKAILFDTKPYDDAKAMIDAGQITTPPKEAKKLGIGYLMSDHDAALFVAVKNWQYFNDTYGIALKPQDPSKTRPDMVDLIVNGEKVAEIALISGDAGPQLMQLTATDAAQFAYVGNPPAIAAIDKGTPVKIVMALNLEGSGLVAAENAPASDWPTFVQWAKDRSAAGKPLVIAAPGKGSIQDVMLRYALKDSGLSVREV